MFDIKPHGRYKALLVAQGFLQKVGQDFDNDNTFSPVGSCPTLRALWAVCAKYDVEMKQLDVTAAFLITPLEEIMYKRLAP